jgi:type I restriction enzyme R subunit
VSHAALNEAETRAELIDPALKNAGWGVVIAPGRLQGGGRRGQSDIADYVLIYQRHFSQVHLALDS